MDTDGVTLLLVEDDAVDAEAIRRAFRQQEISSSLVVVKDGVEALAALRGEGPVAVPYPRVVLLDLNMPRMNGIEFLRALRADPILTRTVVFVLTTSDREEDKVAAYNHHVAGYILKSRVGTDFLDVPQLLAAYWRLVELPPPAPSA